jgi:hypothetical protein
LRTAPFRALSPVGLFTAMATPPYRIKGQRRREVTFAF